MLLLHLTTIFAALTIRAAAVAVPIPVALQVRSETTCAQACGSASEWCSQGARDKLLAYPGCLGNSGHKFVFLGGEISARYENTHCVATFVTAKNNNVLVDCLTLEDKLNTVINRCFVDRDSGSGYDYLPISPQFWYFGINTCDGGRLAVEAVSPGGNPAVEVGVALRVGEARGLEKIPEEDEERQVIDFLLERQDGVKGTDVFNLPYSGGAARTLCQLGEKEPKLREMYGGCL